MELQNADAGGRALPPNARLLLRTVYIMGVVLVLLLIAVIAGIVWKATRPAVPKEAMVPASLDLGLAADERVVAAALDGDRLALTTTRGIVIVDLRKHAVTARIAFTSTAQ